MGIDDCDYVNGKLNAHLKKVNKAQTNKNRAVLRTMSKELKRELKKERVMYLEYLLYIQKNIDRLD